MNSFKDNQKSLRKAISNNRHRNNKEIAGEKFPHQVKKNFPEPDKKSNFDMTEAYYNKHMKPNQ